MEDGGEAPLRYGIPAIDQAAVHLLRRGRSGADDGQNARLERVDGGGGHGVIRRKEMTHTHGFASQESRPLIDRHRDANDSTGSAARP